MKAKLLKKIRKGWLVKEDCHRLHIKLGFRFVFIKRDYSKDYIIDHFHSINKFCYDNGFYDYGQYLKFEIKKTIRLNNKRFTLT